MRVGYHIQPYRANYDLLFPACGICLVTLILVKAFKCKLLQGHNFGTHEYRECSGSTTTNIISSLFALAFGYLTLRTLRYLHLN